MKQRDRIFALLTALSLLLGLLAGCGSTATAATMKLRKTKGSVRVLDDAGKSLETERNLGLYSGYEVRTKDESYAWIDLDEVKLTKLDEDSSVEITQNGGALELELKSGALFFNITEPLEDDESLEIRTSSMVVGIRGTCGWVTEGSVALLEGEVSVTAGEQSATVNAGEMAVVTDDGTLEILKLSDTDIPDFVRDELDEDLDPLPDEPEDELPPEGPGDELPPDGPEDITSPDDTATGEVAAEGTEGNITWRIYENGLLTISGTGDIEDHNLYESSFSPWKEENITIRSVVIEPGVTSIGSYAFDGCSNLTSVTIPDSVTSIGQRAFNYCIGLTEVDIPDSVTSIESHAFNGCSNLTSVTISDGVTAIGYSVFSGCGNLTSVTIPDGVTSIGDYAFNGCLSLTSVTIPDSVTYIGNYTFSSCTSLTGVTIPDGVTYIGAYAFSGCTSLTGVTIPDGVTYIGGGAFAYCTGLTSVEIPDGVTSISDSTFGNCAGLTSVTIPDSVTFIGRSLFSGCTSLTDVYFAGSQDQFEAIVIGYYNDELLNATIHYGS